MNWLFPQSPHVPENSCSHNPFVCVHVINLWLTLSSACLLHEKHIPDLDHPLLCKLYSIVGCKSYQAICPSFLSGSCPQKFSLHFVYGFGTQGGILYTYAWYSGIADDTEFIRVILPTSDRNLAYHPSNFFCICSIIPVQSSSYFVFLTGTPKYFIGNSLPLHSKIFFSYNHRLHVDFS